jgi:hypothetical protein
MRNNKKHTEKAQVADLRHEGGFELFYSAVGTFGGPEGTVYGYIMFGFDKTLGIESIISYDKKQYEISQICLTTNGLIPFCRR